MKIKNLTLLDIQLSSSLIRFWDFATSILSENIKKLKGPFGEFFSEKKSHRAENTLREYPLAPLSFLDDIKILLRKLSKNCKNCKIVRIVRKVDHSE